MKLTLFKVLLCCGLLMMVIGCDTSEFAGELEETQAISKIVFTECVDNQTLKAEEIGADIFVEFTATGIHIIHKNLAVTCDFDTVQRQLGD